MSTFLKRRKPPSSGGCSGGSSPPRSAPPVPMSKSPVLTPEDEEILKKQLTWSQLHHPRFLQPGSFDEEEEEIGEGLATPSWTSEDPADPSLMHATSRLY